MQQPPWDPSWPPRHPPPPPVPPGYQEPAHPMPPAVPGYGIPPQAMPVPPSPVHASNPYAPPVPQAPFPMGMPQPAPATHAEVPLFADFFSGGLVGSGAGGPGFHHPRVVGAAAFGVGALLGIITVVSVLVAGYYFYYAVALAPIAGWMGIWLMVSGQPKRSADGSPPPAWGRLGLMAALAFGLLQAIGIFILFNV